MVYHHNQLLTSASIKVVYQIITPNKAIGMFLWFVSNIMRKYRKLTQHIQLISNRYKY